MNISPAGSHRPFWRTRGALALLGFAAVGGFFLVSEHRAHALGVLPYLLLLICPLLHWFGHGHDHGHGRKEERP